MTTLKQIAEEYFEKITKLSEKEELELLKSGNFEKFCKYIERYSLCPKAQLKLFDKTELKLFGIDLKYLNKYIEKYYLCDEAQLKLFGIDPRYLDRYIKKHRLCPKAQQKLKANL